mgnify:CR=1 FL=1
MTFLTSSNQYLKLGENLYQWGFKLGEERRTASIETVLVELGKLSQMTADTRTTLVELSLKVGIQNGRVGKIERWQAFLQGCGLILVLLVAPVVVQFLSKAFVFITKQ